MPSWLLMLLYILAGFGIVSGIAFTFMLIMFLVWTGLMVPVYKKAHFENEMNDANRELNRIEVEEARFIIENEKLSKEILSKKMQITKLNKELAEKEAEK